jgi:DNA-binding FadR family transcriptional regulator
MRIVEPTTWIQNGDSKASRLAEEFQRHIDSNGLPPGSALGTKAAIGERHDVSLGTLNEALRLLQVRDYVVVKSGPKGGVFVGQKRERSGLTNVLLTAQDHPQHVNDCLRIQDALQKLVASEGASGCDARHASLIERVLARLEAASSPREIFEINWDIDREIAKAGNNRALTEMYCALLDSLRASIRWFEVDPEMAEGARRIHVAMARAVMANDVDGAVAAARLHSPEDGTGPAWRFAT